MLSDHLAELRRSFEPSGAAVLKRINKKIQATNSIPGKQRFWVSISKHAQNWISRGGSLTEEDFGDFWVSVCDKGLRCDGIMSLEFYTKILDGRKIGWIQLQRSRFGTDEDYIEIMEADHSLTLWKSYYKKVLMNGKDADDVLLAFPELSKKHQSKKHQGSKHRKKKRKSLTQYPPLSHLGAAPFSLASALEPPLKKRKTQHMYNGQTQHMYNGQTQHPQQYGQHMYQHPQQYAQHMYPFMYGYPPHMQYPSHQMYSQHAANNGNEYETQQGANNHIFQTQNGSNNHMYQTQKGANNRNEYQPQHAQDQPQNEKNKYEALTQYNSQQMSSSSAIKTVKSKSKKVKKAKKTVKDPMNEIKANLAKLGDNPDIDLPRRHQVVIGITLLEIHCEEESVDLAFKSKTVKELLDALWNHEEPQSYQLGTSHCFGKITRDRKSKTYTADTGFKANLKSLLWNNKKIKLKVKEAIEKVNEANEINELESANELESVQSVAVPPLERNQ